MRHVGDTLVWLGLILVVAAVVYFTPRFADYVSSMGAEHGRGCSTCREVAFNHSVEGSDLSR
jgi:hypothetical protein